MYTYKISKRLCEILNTEFDPTQLPSDQQLELIPEDLVNDKSGNFWKDKKFTESHKNNIAKAILGKKHSPETILKMSLNAKTNKGKKINWNPNSRRKRG